MYTSLVALAAIASIAIASPVLQARDSTEPTSPPYLDNIAKRYGKTWFGTAADIPGPEQQNQEYMTILNDTKIFGALTPANYMKYEYTEPEQNVFNYTGGDVIIDIAKANGQYVRCHNLIWSSQLPTWLTSGNWTNATLTAVMKNHIINLVTHWSDSCYSWDVVNEALNDNGTLADSIWYQVIGAAYFPLAFQFAQEAVEMTGKDIKLYYNDYNIEYPSNKTNAAVALIQDAQNRGIRIDGVGLESHFIVGETPGAASQAAAQSSFTSLGLDVVHTEIDVRFANASDIAASGGYAQQATDYYNTVSACMQNDKCIAMTVWDFDDEYSWIPSTFPGQGLADLYDANFTRKPAYHACAEALKGKACTVCA